jgi:TolB-like protein/Tfp pilus assembly protein PilF
MEQPSPSQESILEQLGRMLASGQFRGMDRSKTLLQFLVQQALRGEGARLKEYTIGTEALGKAASFDPRTDPIVRAEISRLRTRLERYYATEGENDPLVILLPRGSYVPQFQNKTVTKERTSGRRTLPRRPAWLALGIGVIVTLLVFGLSLSWRAPPNSAISLAVLPFANLSNDPGQEFFSDGITEEITTALARIPDLRVVARESASRFRGEAQDLRAVGQALGATHLIAGSVRKDGTRVRITVRLIMADASLNVWGNSYERELKDVFAIQEEIATSIAGALSTPLGLVPGEQLVSNRSIDPATYEQYLRANALVRSRGFRPITDAATLLEQIVASDSDFAPAWALLALDYDLMPLNHPAWLGDSTDELRTLVAATQPKAEAAAQKAVERDPNLADGYLPLGRVYQRRRELLAAEDLFVRALALDPTNPEGLLVYSNFLAGVGRLKEALAAKQRLQALEPFVPVFTVTHSLVSWLNRQDDAAMEMSETLDNTNKLLISATIHSTAGRHAAAAAALEQIDPSRSPDSNALESAIRLLRSAPAAAAPKNLPHLGYFAFAYLPTDAPERSIERFERNIDVGYFQAIEFSVAWHPAYAPVRKTERFKTLVRKTGLVDYWRAKGWPEFCHPTTVDDFACE